MIAENVQKILFELPPGVQLVGAAKTRTPQEIEEAVAGGLEIIGENYVQEAEKAFEIIGHKVKWHLIGHLQTNKARKAIRIFDMIETVDTFKLAKALDQACQESGKVLPVLIEINSGEEIQKAGVRPNEAAGLVREISTLPQIKVMGLMTMGPLSGAAEESRPYFQKTKILFEQLQAMNLAGAQMKYLSMGMSDSYKIALQEGANLVRIGTALFGPRPV
jgi:hypothetical protein